MITVSALIPDCIEQLRGCFQEKSRENFVQAPDYYRLCVPNCSYVKETKAYCKNIVKRSKLLDEMAANARAEVLRIEAARLEAHRLLLRRKAELSKAGANRKAEIIDHSVNRWASAEERKQQAPILFNSGQAFMASREEQP